MEHSLCELPEFLMNFIVLHQSRTEDEDLRYNPNVLALDNVTWADEGWYSCIVGNSMGRSVTSAYIAVVEGT